MEKSVLYLLLLGENKCYKAIENYIQWKWMLCSAVKVKSNKRTLSFFYRNYCDEIKKKEPIVSNKLRQSDRNRLSFFFVAKRMWESVLHSFFATKKLNNMFCLLRQSFCNLLLPISLASVSDYKSIVYVVMNVLITRTNK